jgi:endonuclease/exonuclease/phosphatase (EEP) superfamily protein YafD
VLAAVAVWPQLLGLSGLPVVANAVALRGAVALAAAAGALVALGAVVVLRRVEVAAAARAASWVAVWCAVVATAHLAVLVSRGTDGLFGADPAPAPADRMVVLVLNTHGTVSAADIATLVAARGADVVSLPETSAATAERASVLLADRGLDYQVLAEVLSSGTNPSTAALVSTSTGDYRITDSGPAATFVATGSGPTLTVVHTRAPVDKDLAGWAASTRAAVSSCAAHPGGIVAGDFNATLDHPAFASLGGCVDAAAVAGSAGVATWPSSAPRAIGAPIDHVLVDPTRWTVLRTTVLDPPPGTDHRVVEAVLAPAGPASTAGSPGSAG